MAQRAGKACTVLVPRLLLPVAKDSAEEAFVSTFTESTALACQTTFKCAIVNLIVVDLQADGRSRRIRFDSEKFDRSLILLCQKHNARAVVISNELRADCLPTAVEVAEFQERLANADCFVDLLHLVVDLERTIGAVNGKSDDAETVMPVAQAVPYDDDGKIAN